MSQVQFSPEIAARFYRGPRFRKNRMRLAPHQARQTLAGIAEQFKWSFDPWVINFGRKIEAWLKRKCPTTRSKII